MKRTFYRDNDADAIRLEAARAVKDARQWTEGIVTVVNPSGTALVKLSGSAMNKECEVTGNVAPTPGAHVILFHSSAVDRYFIMGTYTVQNMGGNPGAAGGTAVVAAAAPNSTAVVADYGMLFFTWTPSGVRSDLVFEVEVANDAIETGAVFILADGSALPLAVAGGTTKYFRVRSVDNKFNKSGWTAWASGVALSLPADVDYYQTLQVDDTPVTQRAKLDLLAGTHITLTPADDAGGARSKVTIDAAWPTDTDYYQTVQVDGTPVTQRPTLDLIAGTNVTLTPVDDGAGTRSKVTIDVAASALTVAEQDGAPSVANVSTIKVTNGTLTDDGGGVVSIDTGGGGGGGPALPEPRVLIRDEKAQNTAGGTFTSGAWRTRDLNTEVIDTDSLASVAANQITLLAGTYDALIRCPTYGVGNHQARLQDVTNAATLLVGTSEYTTAAGAASSESIILGRFTLAASTVLEVQHQCGSTQATNGFGAQVNFTTEIYTVVDLRKVEPVATVATTKKTIQTRTVLHDETLIANATFDVASIDQTYDQLELIAHLRANPNADVAVRLSFNNDTTDANYREGGMYLGAATGQSDAANRNIGAAAGSNEPAGYFGDFVVRIPMYTSGDIKTAFATEADPRSSTAVFGDIVTLHWHSTSAINRVLLDGANADTTWAIGSRLQIVGIKEEAVVTDVGSVAGAMPYILIRDEKAQGTAGGTFTSGAWRTRDLNTEVIDTDNLASVASNQITLEAGTYEAYITAPLSKCDRSQAKLYNVTDAANVLLGTTGFGDSSNYTQALSVIAGRFTLSAQKVLEVRHQCQTTSATFGFGIDSNFGTEIYTVVELRKVGA